MTGLNMVRPGLSRSVEFPMGDSREHDRRGTSSVPRSPSRAVAGKPNPTLELYVALMTEVKIRIQAIDLAAGPVQAMRSFPGALIQEFCFLQLRMTCELISLACLVAHGDIKA